VLLNKLTTYKQLKDLSTKGYDIFVNLCEGYLEWEVPSIDVINTLDLLNLPYTGPNVVLYDPPKPLMKYVAYCAGVKTPASVEVTSIKDIKEVMTKLSFPMFVKPAKAGDSLGVDDKSLVNTEEELKAKVNAILAEYPELLIEQYIAGRDFTEVYILWDENPVNGSPQNHSCDANTAYSGLDVVAVRNISEGEELTLDYALFLDHNIESFNCQYGA
jgi:D-alanine-D-alanine ligase-like ATP-grasp enzyme